ncbi:MAG: hypothetical protein QF767_06205 [Alphaproteobacteria bacterium]|nr:hypothetical protein [Alphaproteobacteria bacterium]
MAATKNSDGLNKLLEYVDNVPPPEELTALREGAEAGFQSACSSSAARSNRAPHGCS